MAADPDGSPDPGEVLPDPANRELTHLVERHARNEGAFTTAYSPLTLLRATSTAAPAPIVQEPALCVVAQGRKRVLVGDVPLVYDEDRYLLASVDLPVFGEVLEAAPGRPYLALRLDLDRATVSEIAHEIAETTPTLALGLAVSPLDWGLRDSLLRLLRLLDEPAHLAALAPLAHREIAYRILTGPQGPRLRAATLERGPSGAVAKAVAMLRRDYARPLRVGEIARAVGLSESGLHHHFKAVTAMSPLQFQKRLRLLEARRLMLGESEDATGAAYRVGYESASQFGREYRRLFGAPPARDVASLRTAPL